MLAFLPGSARKTVVVSRRSSTLVRAEPTEKASSTTAPAVTNEDIDKFIKTATEKWDAIEDKTSIVLYGTGAIALLWIVSSVVNAVNGLPLVPKFLELVGLVYTSWFVYRYLLFKSSREELLTDIDELKKKVSGDE